MPITARLCLLLGLVSACDVEPGVVVNERFLEVDQAGTILDRRGSGCMTLGTRRGGAGAGAGAADFSVSVRTIPAGLLVETSTDLEPAQTRVLSEATLRSGELQSFRLQTRAGKIFDLRFWGSDRCEPLEVNGPQR